MKVARVTTIYFISCLWSACSPIVLSQETLKLNETTANSTTNVNNSSNFPKQTKIESKIITEGGSVTLDSGKDMTHMGREHLINNENTTKQIVNTGRERENTTKIVNATISIPSSIPVVEVTHDKKSVPRKGVSFSEITPSSSTSSSTITTTTSTTTTSTTTTSTTTTTKPTRKKKPTITEADDSPPTLLTDEKKNKTENKTSPVVNHGLGIEAVTEKERKPDYVVPIVVVILFVPLIAIIISVLYKRGAEWWQHRHYRRMDFLIEGMYNN